ncbi:hypothetical protein Tco_1117712 [Tanacetum coccineum]
MNLSNINWCKYVWRLLKTSKKGWKKGKNDSYFRGLLTVLTMCYVYGTKCNSNIVCHRRPLTKVWTAKLLSEREAEELNCGGFGYGEMEEDFVDEEGDHIPNNIEYINSLKYTSGGNKSGTNATMHTEKEKDVHGEDGCPSMNRVEVLNEVGFKEIRNEEVEVGVSDFGVKEQTPGSGNVLMGQTTNSLADVVVDTDSLFRIDRQENMVGMLTQKSFECVADEVDWSIEKSKIMESDDIPNFGFGVTQDFDGTPIINNEKRRVASKSSIMRSPFYDKVADVDSALNSEEIKVSKYLFQTPHQSDTELLFKEISGQQSTRFQMESLVQDFVETNILDTWATDKDTFSELRHDDGRFKRVVQHVEPVTRKSSELNSLEKIDLHADFGRYLYGLDHIKSGNIINAELEIGEYAWQTATEKVKEQMDHASGVLSDVHLSKGPVKIK